MIPGMSAKEESKYAYSFGVVKALEPKLLTKDKFERLIEAKSATEVLRTLAETPYGELAESVLNKPEDFEELLALELKRTYELLIKVAPEKKFIDLFYIEYDSHNLKVLLKAKLQEELKASEAELADLFLDLGTIGKTKFLDALKLELVELAKKFEEYSKVLQEVQIAFAELKDPRIIENFLDCALFEKLWEYADDEELLKEIVQTYADLANLKIAVRSKGFERDKKFLSFIPHGKISVEGLYRLYEKGLDSIIAELSRLYEKIVPPALQYYERERSWLLLEKLVDDLILEKLKSKNYLIGIEPLIGYLLAKKTEIKLLRMILVAKLANLPVEKIRKAWRELYV